MEPEQNIKYLGSLVGLAFITVGSQTLVNYISGDNSLRTIWPSAAVCVFGIALILVSFIWHPTADATNKFTQTLARWASSPIPYTLILLLLWTYFESLAVQRNIEMAQLRNDEQSITKALDRFVLPRQLTAYQINRIGSFLQFFPPQELVLHVIQGDEEAGGYEGDLRRALVDKGGWHVKSEDTVADAQGGLTIGFTPATDHEQTPSDWKHPKGDLILQEALGLAGVRANGGGGSGGGVVAADYVTVTVGHRRRDSYAFVNSSNTPE